MRALLQRVRQASVEVNGQTVASIGSGLLVFLGIEQGDDLSKAQKLAEKVLSYRIFSDQAGKMNLNLEQAGGELLIVSQFTLVAQTNKGLRPDFGPAAQPEIAEQLYLCFIEQCQRLSPQCGQFGARMQVHLTNDGPVTFLLEL